MQENGAIGWKFAYDLEVHTTFAVMYHCENFKGPYKKVRCCKYESN